MVLTYGEHLKLFITANKISSQEAATKLNMTEGSFRTYMSNLRKNQGSLQSFIENIELLGAKIEFIFINKESKEKISEYGSTVGNVLRKIIMLHNFTIADIISKLNISNNSYHSRINSLSENVGQIQKLIEFADALGYEIDLKLTKIQE